LYSFQERIIYASTFILLSLNLFHILLCNLKIQYVEMLVTCYFKKIILIFIYPCIVIYVVPNYSQQDATFLNLFIFTDALHVSGGFSAHHQEHITVHTTSGIVNQHCC